jgi:tetratricopeptide (TPR) repeat protein
MKKNPQKGIAMSGIARIVSVSVLLLSLSTPALAWNVETQRAIITSAARVMSRDGDVPLARLERDLRAGASLSQTGLRGLMPQMDNPVLAVHGEVQLLQAVRGDLVDPYLVFRLGALGRLVAQISAPMATAKPLYRDQFDGDVGQRIGKVALKPAPSEIVDPLTFLRQIKAEASSQNTLIQKDYQTGVGFKGISTNHYVGQVNRSVQAVVNIWRTALMGKIVIADVSDTQRDKYILDAMGFYVERGNLSEIDAAYARLMARRGKDGDLMKQIGDMFYAAEKRERAVQEYQAILTVQPSRTDVVRRIADYYVDMGNEELEKLRLEVARGHFAKALETDKLHPTAEVKRLTADKLISERDERERTAQEAVAAGKEFEETAEEKSLRKDYAGAISDLKHASEIYRNVTGEFPMQRRRAQLGMNTALTRISEMREELMRGATSLGGSLGGGTARKRAAERAAAQGDQALRSLLKGEYKAQMRTVDRDLADQLSGAASGSN